DGAPGWYGLRRSCPRSPWALPRSATATAVVSGDTRTSPEAGGGTSPVFDDLEDDLAVRAGRDGIEDRSDRLCGTSLLADHPANVFLGDLELEHRGRVALGFFHLDGLGMIHQLLGQERHQVLHGKSPAVGPVRVPLVRPASCRRPP